ncbi:hypothetical protein GW17_00052639 [Ensete ventricosum]|nr:hypothetical protein GW17_00052639 [Ensete ventricosum]
MRLETCQECIRSSPRVSGVCHDGTREFARRRPRLAGILSRVAEKACRDGISPKFTRKFVEGIEKLVGNTPGDRRKKTRRLIARMPEAADWQELGFDYLHWSLSVVIIES